MTEIGSIKIGDTTFDVARATLRGPHGEFSLRRKTHELLTYLLERPNQLVTKDEMLSTIWPDVTVSEGSVFQCISELRQAFGPRGRDVIKTMPARGYMLNVPGLAARSRVPARDGHDHHLSDLSEWPSIAVLPFVNMTGDPDQEYISDGIAEDILAQLTKLRWLFVISRNSSFKYRGQSIDAVQVSCDLGVRYVFQGSFRSTGHKIRITGQLIDTSSQRLLWADKYDCELLNIFSVQDEITTAVTGSLGLAISDVERIKAIRKPAEKLNSWEAYQRGMWHMLRHDPASLRTARTFFEMAVELDPTFASPLSELARTYTQASAVFSDYPVEEALNRAELAARQAVALDREHPGARATLGQVLLLRGNLTGAVQEAERSLTLASSCAEGHGVKGAALLALADFAEARNALRACIRIDPIGHPTPVRLSQIAAAHYFEADYDLAANIARDVIQRSPTNPNGYRVLAASLGQLGELRAANEAWTQYVDLNPSSVDLQIRHCPPWRLPAQHEHLQQGLRLAGWMD